jgi:histone-lysine N-methyltransferase SETMAR
MPELFFNSSGIVHMKFIPAGATVNKHCYREVLRHLCNSVSRKRPEPWCRKNWLLLHDNAPAHLSVLVQEELAKQQVTILPHPPYSPDLTPCDFFFFPRLKEKLLGRQIQSAKEIITATREAVWGCFLQLWCSDHILLLF